MLLALRSIGLLSAMWPMTATVASDCQLRYSAIAALVLLLVLLSSHIGHAGWPRAPRRSPSARIVLSLVFVLS